MRFVGFLAVLLAACASHAPVMDQRAELEAMFDSDQLYRLQMQEAAIAQGPSSPELLELLKKQQPIDEANIERLGQLLRKHGWPRQSVVGGKAAMAAFLVVQHASPSLQKQYLPLLRDAVSDKEARPEDSALLEDRVLMTDGRKQRYGSQLQSNGKGGWEFYPIEDEAHVDERRMAVGLPPLAEYAKLFGFEYRPGAVQQVVPAVGAAGDRPSAYE